MPRKNGLRGSQALEVVVEAGDGRYAEPAGELATAEVGVDEEHPAAGAGCGDGERGGKPDRVGSGSNRRQRDQRGPAERAA